jgi:hypothetical protein
VGSEEEKERRMRQAMTALLISKGRPMCEREREGVAGNIHNQLLRRASAEEVDVLSGGKEERHVADLVKRSPPSRGDASHRNAIHRKETALPK